MALRGEMNEQGKNGERQVVTLVKENVLFQAVK